MFSENLIYSFAARCKIIQYDFQKSKSFLKEKSIKKKNLKYRFCHYSINSLSNNILPIPVDQKLPLDSTSIIFQAIDRQKNIDRFRHHEVNILFMV